MSSSFYSVEELAGLGLGSYGNHVLISRKASLYSPATITIGNHVRIDDFCILSGKISLGSYIHISAQCCLFGAYGIVMEDFSGLSPGTKVLSATDDFGGDYLVGPMIPSAYTNVTGGLVRIMKYVQIGAGSIVFPNLTIEEGVAVGALSLVNRSLEGWKIYAGIPVRFFKDRSKTLKDKSISLFQNGYTSEDLTTHFPTQ
jgi:galactoside O-acetyltransferase